DAHHLTDALDGLDAVEDDGEAQVHLGAERQRTVGLDEDPGAGDVGHVLAHELVERLEGFVDGDAFVPATALHGFLPSRHGARLTVYEPDRSLPLKVELIGVVLAARVELDAAPVPTLCLGHRFALFAGHQVHDRRVRVHDDRVAGQVVPFTPDLPQDLVRDRGARLNLPRAVAVEAGLVHHPREALARPLARHLDQPKLADPVDRGLRLVLGEALFERAPDLLA